MTDKRQHEMLNDAYSCGWILDRWDGDDAIIENDQMDYDLIVHPFGILEAS